MEGQMDGCTDMLLIFMIFMMVMVMMMTMMMTLSLSIYIHMYTFPSLALSLSLCLLLVTTIYDPVMDDSTDSEVKEDAETCRQLLDDSWLGTAMTYRQNPTEVLFFSH
jgi:hypothetical protein